MTRDQRLQKTHSRILCHHCVTTVPGSGIQLFFLVDEVSTGPMTSGFLIQTFFFARYVRANDLALGVARLVCHLHHFGLSH